MQVVLVPFSFKISALRHIIINTQCPPYSIKNIKKTEIYFLKGARVKPIGRSNKTLSFEKQEILHIKQS